MAEMEMRQLLKRQWMKILQNWKKLHEFFDQYATLQCKEIIKKQEENKRRKTHRHNILKMQNIKDEENKF